MASIVQGFSMSHLFLLCCCFFFFAVDPSWARLSPNDAALVNSVCGQKTVQPNFDYCVQLLTSDPRTLSSDLLGLERVALEFALKNVTDTLVLIYDLQTAATEDTLKLYLGLCFQRYTAVVTNFQEALKAWISRSFVELEDKVISAAGEAEVCEKRFSEPPTRDFPLTDRSTKVQILTDIISAIGYLLRH